MTPTLSMRQISVLFFVLMFAAAMPLTAPAQENAIKLPGARPVIDAGAYFTLQAAFDALGEGGGLVRLPAGQFEISEPIVIRGNDITIEGAGAATHIKNTNTEGKPAILVEHAQGASRKNSLWRVRLANFRVTGNPLSGAGIEARHVNEIFIDGVTVSEHGSDGIHLYFCYEDPRVCDSLLTYNKGTGLNLHGCHDIVVSANQFEENQDALHCIDAFNLTMTGNNLDDHLGRGVVIENTYGSVVSGNMIEECVGAAIVLDRDCYGITLSANVVAHNGEGILLADAHGCAVSANTFTLMKANALYIGPGSGRIAVAGNSFCNSYIGKNKVRRRQDDLAAAGLVIDGAENIVVSGNVFSSVRPKAFEVRGKTRRIVFANNVLVDAESDHDNLPDSIVADNLVSEPAEAKE